MAVTFNKGNQEEQSNPNNIIKKLVEVIQKLEQEIIDNKRTINSKVNGNTFSLTEKLRSFDEVVESINVRVSTIGERTPEELTTEPVKSLIVDGYNSIQIKCSAEILNKSTELTSVDHSLSTRIDEEKVLREKDVLSLATNLVSFDERNNIVVSELKSRFDAINPTNPSSDSLMGLSQKIENLTTEVTNLRNNINVVSAKLDKEVFTEMNNRINSIKSIETRLLMLGG
jgi:hypothetical protein